MGDQEDNSILKKGDLDEDEFESPAFVQLEADFNAVLTEIGGDKQLEKFRIEYEKMHRALRNCHDNERKLVRKCKELNNSIAESTIRIQRTLKMSQEDNETIRLLKSDLEKALKLVDASRENEVKSKSSIEDLRAQITQLGKIVEEGSGLAIGQDSTVNELLRAKEELTKDIESTNEMISECLAEQNNKVQLLEKLKNDTSDMEKQAKLLKEQISENKKKFEEDDDKKKETEKNLDNEKKKFDQYFALVADREETLRQQNDEKNKKRDAFQQYKEDRMMAES